MAGGSHNGGVNSVQSQNRTRGRGLKWLGVVVPVLAVLLLLVLRVLPVVTITGSSLLVRILSTIFLTLVSSGIAFLASRAYLRQPSPALLWLGTGSLVLALASLSVWELPYTESTLRRIVGNWGFLVASVYYIAWAAFWFPRQNRLNPLLWRKVSLTGAYASGVVVLVIITGLAAGKILNIPTILVQGLGAGLFTLGGLLLVWRNVQSKSLFLFWYSQGVLLLGIGLITRVLSANPNDLISCLARLDTYGGGIFILIAVTTAVREAHASHTPVAEIIANFFRQTRENFERAAENANTLLASVGAA